MMMMMMIVVVGRYISEFMIVISLLEGKDVSNRIGLSSTMVGNINSIGK